MSILGLSFSSRSLVNLGNCILALSAWSSTFYDNHDMGIFFSAELVFVYMQPNKLMTQWLAEFRCT